MYNDINSIAVEKRAKVKIMKKAKIFGNSKILKQNYAVFEKS